MALAGKVKTALDETRTLIVSAQILVGFQSQSAFQERFDSLPAGSRIIGGIALALMLLTVGLLIASSAFHRIAERGETTGRIHSLAGYFAATALVPFAVALDLDLTIALGRAWGQVPAGIKGGHYFPEFRERTGNRGKTPGTGTSTASILHSRAEPATTERSWTIRRAFLPAGRQIPPVSRKCHTASVIGSRLHFPDSHAPQSRIQPVCERAARPR
jgi:hypothetical protein